jgi:hypothetical protein
MMDEKLGTLLKIDENFLAMEKTAVAKTYAIKSK